MATAGVPNAVYIMRTIVDELKQIHPPDYNTAVETVRMPDYQPMNQDGDLTMDVIGETTPALLLWLDTSGEDQSRGHLGGNLAGTVSFIIMGLLGGSERIQDSLLALAEDVRGVMRQNLARKYPGSAFEGAAMDTVLVSDFNYGIRQGSQSPNLGTFVSRWRVTYRFAPPKG